jgi:hypothetical protein
MTTPSHDCPAVDDLAALRTAVTGLAREVETVRRTLVVTASAAELARVADLVTDLSQIVNATATPTDPPPSWLDLPADPDVAATVLADLIGWLGRVYLRYSDAARGLSDCWLWHPDVVEELVWLRHAWHDAYKSGDASVRAAGDWHDRLRPGAARRIATYTKACSLESHLPGRGTGAALVPMTEAAEPIAAWWVQRRTEPGPAPTDDQLQTAAAAARLLRGGAR